MGQVHLDKKINKKDQKTKQKEHLDGIKYYLYEKYI